MGSRGLMSLIACGAEDIMLIGEPSGHPTGNFDYIDNDGLNRCDHLVKFKFVLTDPKFQQRSYQIQLQYLRQHLKSAQLHLHLDHFLFEDLVQRILFEEHPHYQTECLILANT